MSALPGRAAALHDPLFVRVRELLQRSESLTGRAAVAGYPVEGDFGDLYAQVAESFAVFVCGEFNAGKSSLINALAGEALAAVGVLPTTREIAPLAAAGLAGTAFVDSPGTNSIFDLHDRITARYLRRSDCVLFVTSVERPLTDSELRFLREVTTRWQRPVIVAVNKIDTLTAEERGAVEHFVRTGLESLLPPLRALYLVSSRSGEGVSELREGLLTLFGEVERVRVKLSGPLHTVRVLLAELAPRLERGRLELEGNASIRRSVLARCELRLGEAALLFEAFSERSRRVFSELAARIGELIDEHFGLVPILRHRVFGGRDALKARLHELVDEMELERRLQEIVDDTAHRAAMYRELIEQDAAEGMRGSTVSEKQPFLGVVREVPEAGELARQLRTAIERGMNRLLTFGGAAAASGVGAKVATAAALEVTGVVLMLGLAAVGMRAMPRERARARRQIGESFEMLSRNFSRSLEEATRSCLQSAVGEIRAELEPGLALITRDLAAVEALIAESAELERDLDEALAEIARLG